MASMVQPNSLSARQPHHAFSAPSDNRRKDVTYMPVVRGPTWPNVSSIWQVTPQERPVQDFGSLQTVSPTRSDSLTGPKSPHTPSNLGTYQFVHKGEPHPVHLVDSSVVSAQASVGRSSNTTNSPPRQRGSSSSSAQTTLSMSHLGTATLLSGSAPDVDLQAQNSYSSRSAANRAKKFNVEGVDEFVPAKQNHSQRYSPSRLRYGGTWADSFSVNNHGFLPMTAQSHVPIDQLSSQSEKKAHGAAAMSHVEGWSSQQDDQNMDQFYLPAIYSPTRPPLIDLAALSLNDRDPPYSSRHLGHDHRHRYFQQSHDPIEELFHDNVAPIGFPSSDLRNHGFSNAAPGHPSFNHTSVTFGHGSKIGTGLNGMNSYSPSQTPSTAPGSRRSNSGSGTSTRASSQSVDTGYTSFDASSQFIPGRSSALTTQQNQAGFAYNTHGLNTYAPYLNQVTNRPARVGGAQGHHGQSSEARIQQEKEQNLSPLIKDFRANHKTKRYELKDTYDHIVEFSGDQHGSRFIQAKLETANSEEKEKVFAEIQENALQLMTDIFGNYVIQKMFEHGTQAQKKVLAGQMKGRVYYLTTQVYGCRVVQKALEHVLTDQQASMVKELEGNVLGIVENQNGNHVIQKAIERVPSEHIQFIFDAHFGHVVRLSKHNYGCRVVQRILEHAPGPIKQAILGELRDAIPSLIEDQFGNYVMQHIIRNGDPMDRHMVVSLIQRQLLHFSRHKFASNVVEAAIECAEPQQQEDILRNLTTGFDSYGQSQVYGLIRDQYGNYVIQKVLAKLHGAPLQDLIAEIQHHLVTLRKISHGKQVSAMEKALAEATSANGPQDRGPASASHISRTDSHRRSPIYVGGLQHPHDHAPPLRTLQPGVYNNNDT